MNLNSIVALVKFASCVALKNIQINAQLNLSKSQIFCHCASKLPLWETSKKYPTMTLLIKKKVMKVHFKASGCRHANATPSRGLLRL